MTLATKQKSWYCETALLESGWHENVLITTDAKGSITDIQTQPPSPPKDATRLKGYTLPGICNLHSHAHQRAMAGLAERSGNSEDSFWTWRDIMYRFSERMTPEQLEAVSAQLYLELVQQGYTRVAEFQYCHHQPSGLPYDNVAEMTFRTMSAASQVGIGHTALPVFYRYSGFGRQAPGEGQRRFINAPDAYIDLVEEVQAQSKQNQNTGIAAHSLRAVDTEDLSHVLQHHNTVDTPIHIHIAEQTKEVHDCLRWSGQRPVELLFERFDVNKRWCLVHATHMTNDETVRLAHSGAIAGLCPTTEANLGDGLFNAKVFLDNGGRFGIGSDSHISTSAVEELRWLEYGQRLMHQQRNVINPKKNHSTGAFLYTQAVSGGAQACGHQSGKIAVGYQADWVVLDAEHPILYPAKGTNQHDSVIDSWVFSGNQNAVSQVIVSGNHVIQDGHHPLQEGINQRFRQTLDQLKESV